MVAMYENVYGKDCWIGYGGDCFHTLANAYAGMGNMISRLVIRMKSEDLDDYSTQSKYKSVALTHECVNMLEFSEKYYNIL